jgi:hypothetical protein
MVRTAKNQSNQQEHIEPSDCYETQCFPISLYRKEGGHAHKLPLAEVENRKKERGIDMNQGVLFQVRIPNDCTRKDLRGKVLDIYGISKSYFVFYNEEKGHFDKIEVYYCTRI